MQEAIQSNQSSRDDQRDPAPGQVGQKASSEGRPLLPTPREIIEVLSKKVIGHDHAKRTVAVAVYQHLLQCAQSDVIGGRVEAENHVLIHGPSGSGKSHLLRCLEAVGIPMHFVSCTNITPNGYRGRDFLSFVEEIRQLVVDDGRTSPAIVVWDEIDKLALHGSLDSQAMVYRKMTQMDFLTFLDGIMCGNDNELDASRILSIGCGAFVGLDQIRNRKATPSIGFLPAEEITRHGQVPLLPQHLVEYGMMTELVGRFARITSLDPLDRSVLRKILTEADGNVLERRREFFEIHGVRLEFTDGAIDALVEKAMRHETGARALRLVVDQVLHGVEHRLPEMAEEGISALVVDKDVVLGNSQPLERKGEKQASMDVLHTLRQAAVYPKLRKKPSDGLEGDY